MSMGSGSPPGIVGSAGVPGISGGASGMAGTSGTDSGMTYSAVIARYDVPGGATGETPGSGVVWRAATQAGFAGLKRQVRTVLLRAALTAASVCMLAEASGPTASTEEAARIFAISGTRSSPVQSYSSKLQVDFALRSFPYLKFHLTGHIEYKRPNLYSVHFDHVPWFGKGFENMKMDPLEPQTWPEHYDIASVSQQDGRTHVEMRDKVAGNIKGVHAELDSDGLRRIQWQYTNGGRIDVQVNPTHVEGVPVPETEDAEIKLPAYHVVAHAKFSDYKIVTDQTASTGTGSR
jgi:hypothetical protein